MEQTSLVPLGPSGTGIVTLPPAAAPRHRLPVVLLLPDAEGAGPRSLVYGQRMLENGYAVLETDFGGDAAEGLPPGPAPAEQLGLALAAIAADARLDARRVAVVGLGEGARATLLGLAEAPSVAALALLYPGCDAALAGAARAARGAPRVLLMHGDEDAANDAAACAGLAGAFPEGSRVQHRVLVGASYGWDAASLVRPGGTALLPHPAGGDRRAWSQPSAEMTLVAADRVLGFVMTAVGRP